MISTRRRSVYSKLHEFRDAFCCISRALVGNALTLVYAARDTEHNDAVVHAEVLRRGLPRRSGSG